MQSCERLSKDRAGSHNPRRTRCSSKFFILQPGPRKEAPTPLCYPAKDAGYRSMFWLTSRHPSLDGPSRHPSRRRPSPMDGPATSERHSHSRSSRKDDSKAGSSRSHPNRRHPNRRHPSRRRPSRHRRIRRPSTLFQLNCRLRWPAQSARKPAKVELLARTRRASLQSR